MGGLSRDKTMIVVELGMEVVVVVCLGPPRLVGHLLGASEVGSSNTGRGGPL